MRLDSAGFAYMLSGSLALSFYGKPRMTRDIDVVVDIRGRDVTRFVQLFAEDFYVDEGSVRDAAARRGMFNIIHNGLMIKVDVIARGDDPYRREELERRRTLVADPGDGSPSFPVRVAAPEDLLLSKLVWAKDSLSETQLGDARNIVQSVPDLDWSYVETWGASLGVAPLLAKVRP